MRQKLLYSIIFTVLLPYIALASMSQDRIISGLVTGSEDNEPLPGANVVLKGTSTGTITGLDGAYSISVPDDNSILVFSSVGFITEELIVGNRTVLDISLVPDITALDEIVVVGYGTQKKEDVIGSISTVKSDKIMQVPAPSFVSGLQGQATGVQVSSASGVPGAKQTVKIRGVNSISSGTDPLWIVDGMPIYSGGGLEQSAGSTSQDPMSLINPNDIESIEILKDAAATAI
jgi:outer membrane receptor protein involved in Fe transport